MLHGSKEIKLGALHPTRDLVFVKDTVRGFTEIAATEQTIGQEVNIATQNEISVLELAEMLISLINPDAKIVSDDNRHRPKNSEVERLLGSNAKLQDLTGWKPGISLKEGLCQTIEWFSKEENLRNYKSDIYNL